MIRTTKLIYVGSTAAKAQGIEYKKGLAKPGQTAAHGVKQVTPRMIAYIALQIRQTLSSSDDWRKEDGHVAKAHFYRKVLAHFQPRLAANDPDDAEEDDRWGHRETAAAPLSEEEQALIDAQTCADNAKLYVWYERLVFGGSAEMTAPKGPAVARPISTADVIQQRRLQQLRRQQQAQPQDDERRRTPAPTSPPHSASASSPDRDPRLLFWQSPVSPHRSPRTPRNSSVSPASPRPIVDLRRPAASPLSSMPPQQSSRTLIDTGSLEPDHRLPRRPEALSAISSSSCHVENQAPGDGATVLSPHPPHRSSETVEPASPTAKGKGKGKGKGKATMKEVPSRIQPRRAKK
ncbi:hypothetical protein BD626DRAFT_65073 [Schizophyllum amplum]|uniref:Uncharacterized protein n=1 Tax=Schizophyllum amplum TaxID=97359 RepID=A0A550CAW3_9AGAR|nr:hypothetical protein BD626DRAFT_65073 [Auriculariopsis ampla]